MTDLLPLARSLRAHGFSRAEASQLAATAREGGVTADERAQLRAIAELYRDDFEPGARRALEDTAEAISVSVDTGTHVDVSVPGIADVRVDTRTRVDVVVPAYGRLKNTLAAWWARLF